MKYIAQPVIVDAYEILVVHQPTEGSTKRQVDCTEDRTFFITPEMTSRITLEPGLFVVIQSDGYVYLNPPEVFYRKYTAQDAVLDGRTPLGDTYVSKEPYRDMDEIRRKGLDR